MFLKSIRWRLPLTYAAIALLATLALGAVLTGTLRRYYTGRELAYLEGNAKATAALVAPALEAALPAELLQPQIKGAAFLSQVRLRLTDQSGHLIADSGPAGKSDVVYFSAAVPAPGEANALGLPSIASKGVLDGEKPTLMIVRSQQAGSGDASAASTGARIKVQAFGKPISAQMSFLAAGTPYGFDLNPDVVSGGPRSTQIVREPVYGPSGQVLGYVELSDGPAYGRQIVDQVAQAWALAGAIAVLLAACAGWLASRSFTIPLATLAGTTAKMAAGDLSARAALPADAPTEFETLAESFNHLAGQIEETVVALRRFVADAAHELHTPLTALRTELELALGTPQAGHIERAQGQAVRMERLVNALLDLSRLEGGASRHERAELDLGAWIRTLGEVYASQAEQAGLNFVLEVPDEALAVEADEPQVRCAVDNLVDNAVKFTPDGGRVTVGLRRAGTAPSAELWVEDSGIGIPEDDLPLLFQRFHRGRNAAAYPGNGLGLAIVKAIMEPAGGQVLAENTGHGARFTLRFPLADRARKV